MKWLMMTVGCLLAVWPAAGVERPVAVFAEWEGTWQGEFVGYDSTGKEPYRIQVVQMYTAINETTQRVEIRDTMPDGTIITGLGQNVATRNADGSLSLRCLVTKSNGDKMEHEGRVGQAPDGQPQIVWYSRKPGRIEIYRETVRRAGNEAFYTIDGVGRYGDQLILMAGRYRRQSNHPINPTRKEKVR